MDQDLKVHIYVDDSGISYSIYNVPCTNINGKQTYRLSTARQLMKILDYMIFNGKTVETFHFRKIELEPLLDDFTGDADDDRR